MCIRESKSTFCVTYGNHKSHNTNLLWLRNYYGFPVKLIDTVDTPRGTPRRATPQNRL